MKTTYIYLNTYSVKGQKYYYVGSHTWDGPVGVVDPTYFGSSHVAENHKLKPVSIKIIDQFPAGSVNNLRRESEWINKYAEKYGIADLACIFNGNLEPNPWQSKFKRHGLMLNGHANNTINTTSPEIRRKAILSRMRNGNFDSVANNKRLSVHEIREKAVKTAIENGSMKKMIAAMHSKESKSKAVKTCVEKGISKYTSACATKAWVAKSRHYRVGDFTGTLKECCIHLGYNVRTVANVIKGWNSGTYKGVYFELLNAKQ